MVDQQRPQAQDPAKARKTKILALVHVALAVLILAGFVWAQIHRAAG